MSISVSQQNALEIGKAGEHLVCAYTLLAGYRAFRSDQGLPYDALIDIKGRVLRIQVKTTGSPKNIRAVSRAPSFKYSWAVRTRGRLNRQRLSDEHSDIAALVALDTLKVAYLPIFDCGQTVQIPASDMDGYPLDEALRRLELGKAGVSVLFSERRLTEFNGVRKSLDQHARDHGKRPGMVHLRLSRGWSLEEALLSPNKRLAGGELEMAWPERWFFEPLLPLHYSLIVIDPPWPMEMYSDKGYGKSADAQYQTMTAEQIKALPVGSLASMDCLLYCWSSSPQLPLTLAAVEAWGFTYKSLMVWRKTTRKGKVRVGTGYRVRTTGEVGLVATLGNPRQTYVPHTVFDGVAREHSRKPDEFYALCDRVMPQARRCDVFARQQRPNWDAFRTRGRQVRDHGAAGMTWKLASPYDDWDEKPKWHCQECIDIGFVRPDELCLACQQPIDLDDLYELALEGHFV